MSMSGTPQGARYRHPYATGAEAAQRGTIDILVPGAQRHQLWDAPVPSPGTPEAGERISMQPARQRHRSIRFGDEVLDNVDEPPIPSPGPRSNLVPPTASRMPNTNLTTSPPVTLPPRSTATVSPFEMVDPFMDDPKTSQPVDYKSPSLESDSTDSLDHQAVARSKSPRAGLYPRGNSDSDREESVSLVANLVGSTGNGGEIRLVKRI